MSLLLLLVGLCPQSKPRFREQVIETESGGAGYNSTVVDLNGDGRPDLVLVTQRKDQVIWYENPTANAPAGTSWKKHLMTREIALPEPIVPMDLEGNGTPALVIGGNFAMANTTDPSPIWLLRRPEDPTTPWTSIKIDSEPSAHRLALLTLGGKKVLVVSCLMGRGTKAPDWSGPGAPLYLLRPSGNPYTEPWTREMIATGLHRVHGIAAVDWDGKGDEVLFVAAFEGIHLFRKKENRWEVAEVIGQSPGASEIKVFRLPGGARALATVEPWHGNEVAIYTGGPGSWKRKAILNTHKVGHGIVPVDFTRTGADSLLVGFRGVKGEGGHAVLILHPLDGTGERWETQMIDEGDMEADAVHAVDLDGDGKIDLVATGKGANVKIYWNQGK